MSYEITCPYCFAKMTDDQVHFRSEKVNLQMNDIIPDDYDDLEDFQRRYNGEDKEDILREYRDYEFFEPKMDPRYREFWDKYGGTTEYSPADEKFGVQSHMRPVINPGLALHQRYLKQQPDGGYLIRDPNGMVIQIELKNGQKCDRRVCCHCHNPLPANYGKHQVKFATLIGITGAGKTVYLSQLLRKIKTYSAQVGLSAFVNSASTVTFLQNNPVEVGKPMPGSTPAKQFQQPLFYDLDRSTGQHTKSTETFVLYDVAGEVFREGETEVLKTFAPFIEHADGIVMLIDPYQIPNIGNMKSGGKTLTEPTRALDAIHNIIASGRSDEKCRVPLAVCMSKADDSAVQMALDEELRNRLLSSVTPIRKGRLYDTVFNAEEYVPISRGLERFFNDDIDMISLITQLNTNYETYDFFAFTALGCGVHESEDGSFYTPIGPVLPKRVEEPLFWLFYKLGYITANRRLPREIYCPECGEQDSIPLPEGSFKVERTGRFFGRRVQVPVNRRCQKCGFEWMTGPEDDENE